MLKNTRKIENYFTWLRSANNKKTPKIIRDKISRPALIFVFVFVFVHSKELLELFVLLENGRADLILLLVLRTWRRASAFVVGLRVVTTSVVIVSLIMVLVVVVVSIGAPATVRAAASSRA